MKKLFLAAIVLSVQAVYGQIPALYECIYRYEVNGKTEKGDLSQTFNCILQIGEENSRFVDYSAFQLDSVSAISGVSDETVKEYEKRDRNVENYFESSIDFSAADAKFTVRAPIGLSYYQHEEAAPVCDWKYTDGTDTVCGYECRKATGSYGGRQWTVWYTEEIPVPYGPWKFAGLPGLVMKAADSENIHSFNAVSFRKSTGNIGGKDIPNVIKTDHRTFEEKKYLSDFSPMNSVNPEDIDYIAVFGKSMVINGIPMRMKEKGFIPLEVPDEKTVKAAAASRPSGGSVRVVGSGSIAK